MGFKLSSTILLVIAVTVQTTVAGDYDGGSTNFNFGGGGGGGGFAGYDGGGHTDGHPIKTIDLGSYVGKHHIPPKVIKITKTVAYKVPVPYPVKVPHGVPYPVPVPKPYPVHVPKYIKIKEQVPVYIPAPHGEQHNHGGGGYEHFNHAGDGGNAGFDGGHAAFDAGGHHHGGFGSADAGGYGGAGNQQRHGGFEGTDAGDDGHHHESFGGVAGFNGGYGGGGSENGHEGYANSGAGDGNYGQYAGEAAHHQSEDGGAGGGGSADGGGQYYNNQQQQQQQHQEQGHGYNDEEQHHGQFSGKYLIYTNPKSGVSAYQTADNNGNHGYHFEQNLASSSYTPAASGNDGDKNGNYQSSRTHQTQSHHTITTNQNYADEADAAGAGGNNYQPEREMVTGSGEYQH